MNLSIRHLLLIVFFLISLNVSAQVEFVKNVSNKGTVAASFLEIGVNARAEAMGGAYTAQRGNSDMIYWNPAGLAFVDGVSTSFSNMEWLANTSFNFASVAVPLTTINSVLAGSFTTLGVPEQAVRADNGDLTGEFYDARDFAVNLSLATRLTETFSFGISTKYISQRIWSEKAVGVGFDFGVNYETPIDGLRIGASISNFGDDVSIGGKNLKDIIDPDLQHQGVNNIPVQYVTEEYPLPQIFRFGIAYDWKSELMSLSSAIDLMHPTGSTESMNLGLEWGFKELVFARVGYQNLFEKDHINGLTLGAGIQYKLNHSESFTFDYALSEWGILGKVHRISVGISL